MDKSMYKYVGILVGLLVLVIVFMWFTSLISNGRTYTYEEVEAKLVEATKRYVEDYPGVLPSTPNTSNTISASALIENGYIKDLSSYTKDETVICNGSVDIFLSNLDNYNYVPSLYCGAKYETIKLADKVAADNDYGVVSGSGLYQRVNGKFITDEQDLSNTGSADTFEYVFRGDEVNNYVKIDENYWRIVSISDTNDIYMIYVGTVQKSSPWDDRYNELVDKNQGINVYEDSGIKSRVMQKVEEFYNGEVILKNKEPYSEKTKYLITPMDICVGKRSTTATDISGKIECSKILEEQYVGLLPAYYYMSASLDDNCTTIVSKSCGNYNYFSDFDDYWWLLTANEEITNEAFAVSQKSVDTFYCSNKSSVRPTILLGSRAAYESGSGTYEDPYIVKYFE